MALIRRTPGMAARIARIACVHPSYITRVLKGEKPASEKIHIAISRAILQAAREFDHAALAHEHPEIQAAKI